MTMYLSNYLHGFKNNSYIVYPVIGWIHYINMKSSIKELKPLSHCNTKFIECGDTSGSEFY